MAQHDVIKRSNTGSIDAWATEDPALRILPDRLVEMTPGAGIPGKIMVQSAKGVWFLEANEGNLRAALDNATYMEPNQGGLVQLPAGEILLSQGVVTVPPMVEIRGVGIGGTTIRQTYSAAADPDVFKCLGMPSGPFEGLQRFVGLRITRTLAVSADGSPVRGCGIDVNGVHSPYIDRCLIENQWAAIINRSTDSDPLKKYSRDIQILNSGISYCAAFGIKLDKPDPNPNDDYSANALYMTNGAISRIYKQTDPSVPENIDTGVGIWINTFQKQYITNGVFILSTTMNGFSRHGIRVSGSPIYIQNVQVANSGGHGIFVDRCRFVTILGCAISLSGIDWSAGGSPSFHWQFDGVRIENAAALSASAIRNANIHLADNIIMQNGGNGAHIRSPEPIIAAPDPPVPRDSNNIRFQNNTINSNGMAAQPGSQAAIKVSVAAGAATCKSLVITGNRARNDSIGVQQTKDLLGLPPSFSTTPQRYGFYYEQDGPPGPPPPTPPPTDGWLICTNAFADSYHTPPAIQFNGASAGSPARVVGLNNS